MDKLVKYREIVKAILTRYYEFNKEQPSSDSLTITILDDDFAVCLS